MSYLSLLVHDSIKILDENGNHVEDHPKNVKPEVLNVDVSGRALLHDSLLNHKQILIHQRN